MFRRFLSSSPRHFPQLQSRRPSRNILKALQRPQHYTTTFQRPRHYTTHRTSTVKQEMVQCIYAFALQISGATIGLLMGYYGYCYFDTKPDKTIPLLPAMMDMQPSNEDNAASIKASLIDLPSNQDTAASTKSSLINLIKNKTNEMETLESARSKISRAISKRCEQDCHATIAPCKIMLELQASEYSAILNRAITTPPAMLRISGDDVTRAELTMAIDYVDALDTYCTLAFWGAEHECKKECRRELGPCEIIRFWTSLHDKYVKGNEK